MTMWICMYLDPVLKLIEQDRVTKVHFFSDGPTSQYRQKLHFYFFCTKKYNHVVSELEHGIFLNQVMGREQQMAKEER